MAVTSGNPIKTTVSINSVTVDAYLHEWRNPDSQSGNLKAVQIILSKEVENIITLRSKDSIGYAVTIKRGETLATEEFLFSGEVFASSSKGGLIMVEARDKLYDLVTSIVTKSFDSNIDTEAGKISEIAKTLINDYSPLSADATSVQDTGTTIILKKFVCNNASVYERLDVLAKIVDYQFYYDPVNSLVKFEPKGYVSSGKTLTVGTDIITKPEWLYDATDLFNEITVVGGEQEVETTETFDGDGSTTQFTLANKPISVKVYVDSVLQTGGEEEATSGTFHYTVDRENKQINFESGSEPASGTDNVEVRYSYGLTLKVTSEDPVSITKYTNGTARAVTHFRPEIIKVADAERYNEKQLERYSTPLLSSKKIRVVGMIGLEIGMTASFVDSEAGISDSLVITGIKKQYPYKYDEVSVGEIDLHQDEDTTLIMDRIRRLEEELGKNQDILIIVRNLNKTSIPYKKRYTRVIKQSVSGTNIFILDHPTYGKLDTAQLGDTDLGAEEVVRVMQGDDDYREFFYDSDFVDTNGTATVDTANRKVTFT